MTLDYILVQDNSYKHCSKLKHLFEHAFPVEERPPLSWLLRMKHQEMYAVELNGEFVALFDIVKHRDMVYLFFLAVKKTYRKKNIGTEILNYVFKTYSEYRIYLMAEDTEVECDNLEERKSRLSFYTKRGLKVSNERVSEFGVQYRILYKTEGVTKQEFIDCMKYIIDPKFFNEVYIHNVK